MLTWIDNAGVSIYGFIRDVTLEDAHRLFRTNSWGVVNGSLAALAHLETTGGVLINVGSVLSETVDTPYPEHAKNYLAAEPQHVPPVYAPEVVADAILACAERPHRNVRVGGAAKMFTALEKTEPGLADRMKMSHFEG